MGAGKAGQAVRGFADFTEAGAEPPALLAEGAGMLAQALGLLDELLGRGGRFGPGTGKRWHTVASCPRATLPSPLVYWVGGGSGRWQWFSSKDVPTCWAEAFLVALAGA